MYDLCFVEVSLLYKLYFDCDFRHGHCALVNIRVVSVWLRRLKTSSTTPMVSDGSSRSIRRLKNHFGTGVAVSPTEARPLAVFMSPTRSILRKGGIVKSVDVSFVSFRTSSTANPHDAVVEGGFIYCRQLNDYDAPSLTFRISTRLWVLRFQASSVPTTHTIEGG